MSVPRIEVSQLVERPQADVWRALSDLADHVNWMQDAESLRFLGVERTGVGTRMEVETRVGPFRTTDVIEITDWLEGRAIGADHRGRFRGSGRFSLRAERQGTLVVWSEKLTFPWWLGGPIGVWLAKPILSRVWKGNLARFAALLSDP